MYFNFVMYSNFRPSIYPNPFFVIAKSPATPRRQPLLRAFVLSRVLNCPFPKTTGTCRASAAAAPGPNVEHILHEHSEGWCVGGDVQDLGPAAAVALVAAEQSLGRLQSALSHVTSLLAMSSIKELLLMWARWRCCYLCFRHHHDSLAGWDLGTWRGSFQSRRWEIAKLS
jgi:hypothetical protein